MSNQAVIKGTEQIGALLHWHLLKPFSARVSGIVAFENPEFKTLTSACDIQVVLGQNKPGSAFLLLIIQD